MVESYEIDMIEKTVRKAIESTEYMVQAYDKQVVNHGPKVKTKQDLQIDLEVLKGILNKLTMAA